MGGQSFPNSHDYRASGVSAAISCSIGISKIPTWLTMYYFRVVQGFPPTKGSKNGFFASQGGIEHTLLPDSRNIISLTVEIPTSSKTLHSPRTPIVILKVLVILVDRNSWKPIAVSGTFLTFIIKNVVCNILRKAFNPDLCQVCSSRLKGVFSSVAHKKGCFLGSFITWKQQEKQMIFCVSLNIYLFNNKKFFECQNN